MKDIPGLSEDELLGRGIKGKPKKKRIKIIKDDEEIVVRK